MTLLVNEIYASIQGETSFTGLPTVFIRLAGCNLNCSWCDTLRAVDNCGTSYSVDDICILVQNYQLSHVCITGGEPLLQKAIYSLMKKLCDLGFTVSLETNGSLNIKNVPDDVHIIMDVKCPDSKMNKRHNTDNFSNLRSHDEIKFVVASEVDYQYAKNILEKYDLKNKVGNILFSPAFDILDPAILTQWIIQDKLPVRLNLQIHKYIWHPNTPGV